MTRSKLLALALAATSLATAVALYAQEQRNRRDGKPPALLRQFVGGGRWQSHHGIGSLGDRAIGSLGDPGIASTGAGWQVQLKHLDDDSLAGRVLVVGSPVLDHAQIQGQITGSEVDGVLLDQNGVGGHGAVFHERSTGAPPVPMAAPGRGAGRAPRHARQSLGELL